MFDFSDCIGILQIARAQEVSLLSFLPLSCSISYKSTRQNICMEVLFEAIEQ